MKKFSSIFAAVAMSAWSSLSLSAEAPANYYSSCEGKKGSALLSALCGKISSHTNVGYDGLMTVYQTSDVKPNGKIWDMYSTKEWPPSQRCGNYSQVGDCYNREHSMPKSWFSSASPMYSDAFHIYPTDGKVNGQRGNYPYGECANGTTLPPNGSVKALGRLGKSTFSGYSGTVFEPDDEYKGDFARSYFYMAACYNNKVSGWKSDMLAGNSYPVFSQWAVNLLLKWHRQDPVSSKETNRNEAVYAYQNNRNPFIDYPDLAEHIWGDRKDQAWHAASVPDPAIASPVNGSTLDFGLTAIDQQVSLSVTVKGSNITEPVSVEMEGSKFSASASSLTAAAVNSDNGATLTLYYTSPSAGADTGTLRLASGVAQTAVTLKAETAADITALSADNVTETSFDARWVCVDKPGAKYTLDVKFNNQSIAGYPAQVEAEAQRYTVSSLTPGTTYVYTLASPAGRQSNSVEVTTQTPIPSIQFFFDGELYFSSKPGEPSEIAELLIDAQNIPEPITISVSAPFELSSDKTSWSLDLPLDDEQDRFYLRFNSDVIGHYTTLLTARAGNYLYDDIEIEADCQDGSKFLETFEAPSTLNGYDGGDFAGTACRWRLVSSLVGDDPRDSHTGLRGFRFNKTDGSESLIEMAEPKEHGVETVTFFARAWSGEGGAVALEASTDGGLSWAETARFEIADDEWRQYTAEVKLTDYVRLRFTRLGGRRINIDDIEATDYAVNSIKDLEYHAWDAYCLNGALTIEVIDGAELPVAIHSPNGATWFEGSLAAGLTEFALPQGVYLVTSKGFTRKVILR